MAQTDYENYTFVTLAGQTTGSFDGTGSAALFNLPSGVAADASGNVYVADTGNSTIRKVTPGGVVTTLAGMAGVTGTVDGSGSSARFNGPRSMAVDAAGNVYVADSTNCAIRKITPAGVVTTLAGELGVSGTNDAATGAAARFNLPYGVAVDTNGNVYVADTLNQTIRKISSSGAVTTLAGLAGSTGSTNGTNSGARFSYPCGVAVDASGNVYVADTGNDTIRQVSPAGVVTTLAGSAGDSNSTDGTGTNALFNLPYGVAVAAGGILYVADTGNDTIRKVVTSSGVVTTLAGTAGDAGSANGSGSAARFYAPFGVAVDANGNVYVADSYNSTLRKVTMPGKVVTTLAGTTAAAGSANGAGSAAQFRDPYGVAVNSAGTVYVSDLANNTIRRITPAGVVTTLAGKAGVSGSANGSGSGASFGYPAGLAVDTNGNVYVADYAYHTIRKITPGGSVTTLAGKPGVGGSTNGTGSAARFLNPLGVAVDAGGNVYVADTKNGLIRKITPKGAVSTLAGVTGTTGTNDGPAATALFNYPQGVAVDASNNVYVADTQNSTIRKITADGVVSTLAGKAQNVGASDGIGGAARFNNPYSIAVDSQGYLYVADTGTYDAFTGNYSGNYTIRKLSPDGTVKTLAGVVGVGGGADGTGPEAFFYFPEGVAVDAGGNVYVADTLNGTIRKGNPALPDAPVVDPAFGPPGTIRQFDVTNLTATSWSWSIVRYPSASSAQLSSTTARDPTLTPDVSDLFIVRFQGTNSLGRATIASLAVSTNLTLPALSITQPQPNQQVTNLTFTVTGAASGDLGVAAVWCRLDGGPWIQAVGTLEWTAVISLTNLGQNTLSACAMDPNGQFSATNSVSFFCAPVVLQIVASGTNIIVSWPAAATGLTLQTTYELAPGSWSTVGAYPVVEGGLNEVTLPMSAAAGFYRLAAP
jgi:sugar lactone lactonase YvrE